MLHAEADWGNSSRDGFVYSPQDDEWKALMRAPLHVDALQAAFELPPGVRVGTLENGDTYLVDPEHRVRIFAVNPHRRLGPPAQGADRTAPPPAGPVSHRPGGWTA